VEKKVDQFWITGSILVPCCSEQLVVANGFGLTASPSIPVMVVALFLRGGVYNDTARV
jgi:hypothetical protein